ncbi:MAG TPA: hypothetical protein VGC41_12305, partial [Kofleriaceae bacterium]
MSNTFSIRFDFACPPDARRVAEVLARPSFRSLDRISGRVRDRWSDHVPSNAETIASYLANGTYDAVSLDSKGAELVASAEIETSLRNRNESLTAMLGYVVLPNANIDDVCALAVALDVSAGFIALEPSYGQAHRLAVGASRPKERDGLGDERWRGRRARDWYADQIETKVATVEWGLFLGVKHVIDLDRLRGAFQRI